MLTKQYTEELDQIEIAVNQWDNHRNLMVGIPTKLKKELAKYIAKKKTPGLEQIVQRAQRLKDRFGKWK